MKKTWIILVLLALCGTEGVKAQVKGSADYLVKYKAVFALDSNNRDQKTTETHYLYTGSTVSYYASRAMIRIDSMMKQLMSLRGNREAMMRKAKEMQENRKNKGIPGFSAEVYKNLAQDSTYVGLRIRRQRFLYREPAVPLDWQFKDSVKQIGSRLVHKAVVNFGGRHWVAWFTAEVPIHDGPYVFSGLPGLILEIYDAQNDYHFSVISIDKLKKPYPIDNSIGNYKELSKEKFIKAYKSFRKHPFGPMASRLRKMHRKFTNPFTGEKVTPSAFIRQIKEKVAERNNYIERW